MRIVSPSYRILTPDFEKVPNAEKIICQKIETVARTCYQSADKVMDGSAERICKNLIARGHEAMLEHASISVLFTVDRGITHEAVRHRMASFAQESSRYVNYSKGKFGENVKFVDIKSGAELDPIYQALPADKKNAFLDEWFYTCQDAERHYLRMLEICPSPQLARSALNCSTASDLVITANIREWRHIFKLRAVGTTGKPHPQMEEIMLDLLRTLANHMPVFFMDLYAEALKNQSKIEGEKTCS